MDKKVLVSILAVSMVACNRLVQPGPEGLPGEELQQVLDESREAGGLIGVSAAIVDGQGNLWSGVSGISHDGQPVTLDMVFDMGSAGKTLAAALMLDLAEEGLIDLDTPFEDYINPPPGVDGSIPIRNLLNHTSGLPNAVEHPDSPFRKPYHQIDFERWWTIEEIFTELGSEPYFEPGEGWHYSQAGYQIASLIVEEVTGSPISENIQTRLLDPLGIEGMLLDFSKPVADDIAIAHNWVDLNGEGTSSDVSARSRNWIASFSRILFYTTAEDFARWGQALFSGQVLESKSLDEMLDFVEITEYGNEPQIFTGYGLGVVEWKPEMLHGEYGYGHSGSIPGYRAFLAYLPEHDLTIAVLSNSDQEQELGRLIHNLLGVVLGDVSSDMEGVGLEIYPQNRLPENSEAVRAFSNEALFCEHETTWEVKARADQWIDLSLGWIVATTPEMTDEIWAYHRHRVSVNGTEIPHLDEFQDAVKNLRVNCPDGTLELYGRGFSIYLPPLDPGEYEIVWRSDVETSFHNGFVEYHIGDYLEARAALFVKGD